jgi:hypothetical protein
VKPTRQGLATDHDEQRGRATSLAGSGVVVAHGHGLEAIDTGAVHDLAADLHVDGGDAGDLVNEITKTCSSRARVLVGEDSARIV